MFVEKAFVINLPFKEDRLTEFNEATKEIQSLPEIQVWNAVHGDTCNPPDNWLAGNGAWGCYRTHLSILEHCLNSGIASYIVFEDDAKFRPDFDINLAEFMQRIPNDWHQAYLGGELQHIHSHQPVKIAKGIYRPYNVNRTHCFMVSRAGMLPMYQHICDLPFMPKEHIDHHLGRWHEDPRTKIYVPGKWLVGQMGDSSNISGKDEPVTFFHDPETASIDHWLYDDPVCVIYRGSRELLRKARRYLHPGNQIDADGFDVTLTLAARFADPTTEIERWYGWIRGEIVRSRSRALPCLYHPRITADMANACSFRSIEIAPTTIEDVEKLHAELQS